MRAPIRRATAAQVYALQRHSRSGPVDVLAELARREGRRAVDLSLDEASDWLDFCALLSRHPEEFEETTDAEA